MKFAILSDIHGNIEALASMFLDLHNNNNTIDRLLITGDIVGYGPNPNECCVIIKYLQKGHSGDRKAVETVLENIELGSDERKIITDYIFSMEKKADVVVGNHDKEVIGQPSFVGMMSASAAKAAKWTTEALEKDNFKFLYSLKYRKKLPRFNIELVHSTPVYPQGWEYPKNAGVLNYKTLRAKITFAGHTHNPAAYLYKNQAKNEDVTPSIFIPVDQFDNRLLVMETSSSQRIEEFDIITNRDHKYYINPGSIGQPRDGIPKASYMVYDTDTRKIALQKAEYNTEAVKEKIIKAKLPRELANRVIKGV